MATSALEGVARRLWGFPPNLMVSIVDQLGPFGSLRWFVLNMPRYERTLSRYGAMRTHLVATTVSLVNGCPYCSYGHALAFELAYFKAFGMPFTLDEDEIVSLHGQPEDVIDERLGAAVRASPISAEAAWMQRMLELCAGAAPASSDDRRLIHIRSMFGVLNACAIAANTARDQAHDPLNKDVALKQSYTAARQRSD